MPDSMIDRTLCESITNWVNVSNSWDENRKKRIIDSLVGWIRNLTENWVLLADGDEPFIWCRARTGTTLVGNLWLIDSLIENIHGIYFVCRNRNWNLEIKAPDWQSLSWNVEWADPRLKDIWNINSIEIRNDWRKSLIIKASDWQSLSWNLKWVDSRLDGISNINSIETGNNWKSLIIKAADWQSLSWNFKLVNPYLNSILNINSIEIIIFSDWYTLKFKAPDWQSLSWNLEWVNPWLPLDREIKYIELDYDLNSTKAKRFTFTSN